jgi:hypothetical protein
MAKLSVVIFTGTVHERKFDKLAMEPGDKSGDILYLVIKSNGGDPGAAMRMMWLMQDRFKKIFAIVPQTAMSAATLMALGADMIYMLPGSALGPLDLQISHPIDESQISAIDVRDASLNIWGLVETLADRTLHNLCHYWDLPRSAGAKIAYDSSINFVRPIIEKIDPYHLNSGLRSAVLSEKYAHDLLKSRMMANDEEQADTTAKYMANEYSYHGYAISKKEAAELLKLKVERLEKLKAWEKIRPLFEQAQAEQDQVMYSEVNDEPEQPQSDKTAGKTTNSK